MNNRFLLFYLFGIIFLTISCADDDEITPELGLSESEFEVISYFKEVALGFENGNSSEITRKWGSNMRIVVRGNPSDANIETLEQAISDINELVTDDFSIKIVSDSSFYNCYIFFGSGLEFLEIFPEEENNVDINTTGYFHVWWNNNIINKARIIINPFILNSIRQKSVILEEITQAIGLGNDSPSHPNSIFYETSINPGYATEYAVIDRELIRLLYHPEMTVGLNENQVDEVLRDILNKE